VILIGQEKRLREPLAIGPRARRGLAVGGVLVALGAAGGIVALVSSGDSAPPAGCVRIPVASTTGGGRVQECGADGRALCAHPSAASFSIELLRSACRQAGDPLGPA
jgi:hypothetical protein